MATPMDKIIRIYGRITTIVVSVFWTGLFLYLLWIVARVFFIDQFVIPTNSMTPTLMPGDRIIVNKFIAGARIYKNFDFKPQGGQLNCFRLKGIRKIHHNDIVVFNFPHHDWKFDFVINNVYCKRCVALPGDTIWSENGYYKNNNYNKVLGVEKEQEKFSQTPDSLLPREILNTFPFDDHFPYTTKNLPHIYVPRKGDVVSVNPTFAAYYKLPLEWELGKEVSWDWEKDEVYANGNPLRRHTFQHDYYFMAGDNVLDSNDSRYWGLVPEEYIVGVVTRISYSKCDKTGKLHLGRILKDVS